MRSKLRTRAGWIRPAALLLALAAIATPRESAAQFVPYYGKNKVKYDNFAWRIYKSPHFEVFYYPEFEQHLGRLTSYLESSYLKISTALKHEMPEPIPVIFYKTHSEFEQTNLFPAFVPEGVAAFTEPVKNRMVLPIDEPPDQLQGLVTHEMVHAFAFDLIPRGIGFGISQSPIPLWVDEGLADYLRGIWEPLDLMMVRDAALTDQVPRLSEAAFQPLSGRLVYNLGHAAFEFIETRYGKEGIRQFLYSMRKGILGGSTKDLFKQAFRTTPEEFDNDFDKWLKERFKPYRDLQRPSDFGRDLSPDIRKGPFTQAYAFTPSPSGELAAVLTVHTGDGEGDVVLVSTRDGKVLKNLTPGYTSAYEGLAINSEWVAGRTLAFDPSGDHVAFFGRTGKGRSLFLVSVLDRGIKRKVSIPLDQPQAPALLPAGRHAVFSALREGVADIWRVDLETGEVENLTRDEYYDNNPQVSPDGKLVVYERHVSGNRKIYAFPLDDPSKKTQLTFGPFDDTAPYFSSDGKRIYYASDEDDDIFNVSGLDLETGAITQYTEVFGGAMAPAPIRGAEGDRLAFITYFKGEYKLHSKETGDPVKEIDQEVRAASEGIVDFQPDITHDVIPENKRRKKLFEGLYLEGRPPINVGVTSSGDLYGGTAVALTDVLGDQLFTVQVLSIRSYRSYDLRYTNLARRLRYGANVFDYTMFFFAAPYGLLPPGYGGYYDVTRDAATASQRMTGAQVFGEYPLDKFRRIELGAGFMRTNTSYNNPAVEEQVCRNAVQLGVPCFIYNGYSAPISAYFVQETTRFAQFGPLTGSTVRLGVRVAPGIGGLLQRQTVDADLRKYLRLGSTSALFAFRARGFYSTGDNPDYFYFGGNMELRGYPYYGFAGNQGFFANAEFRVPIINVALTPIGLIGPIRGTAFIGAGGARFKGEDYTFASSDPGFSYINDPVFGEPTTGWRLVDGRASYGFGVQLFFLGYPMHFDWTKFTDFAVTSEGWDFNFWIGYDF
jgi:Tol biopolymer transport system component